MRFGVVGLGSMGKRRVRDLLRLGHDVVGFDKRPDRNEEARSRFGITAVAEFELLLSAGVEALVISTPPDQHWFYYERGFVERLPFFSEANILTPRAEWFSQREASSGVRAFASATWKFHPLIASLREQILAIGLRGVNTIHHNYGGYLPLWHPWEHYSEFYAGRTRKTCAAREMVPFELEWLCWIFGPVKAVSSVRDRRSEWISDIDDTYLTLLDFESGVRGTLVVELHQVAPYRLARIACRSHSFLLDLGTHELRRYELKGDSWSTVKAEGLGGAAVFDFEQVYCAEIRAFAEAAAGRSEFPKTWKEDRHLSNVLYAAEESSRRCEWVSVDEVESVYDGCDWTVDSEIN